MIKLAAAAVAAALGVLLAVSGPALASYAKKDEKKEEAKAEVKKDEKKKAKGGC
jgi:hypothetical protein